MKKSDFKEIDEFNFPEFEIEKLNNRINVSRYFNNSDFFSYFSISFKEYNYPTELAGLAYFTGLMMKRSTKSMTSEYIAEYLESRGTSFSINVSHDSFRFFLKSLPEYFGQSIDILIDCLFNPAFKEDEIEKYKVVQIAEIKQDLNEPSFLCSQAMYSLIFDGHFYSSPIDGTVRTIKNINREECDSFHNDLINNSKIDIIVGGNFDAKIVEKKINTLTEHFNKKRIKAYRNNKIGRIKTNRLIFIPKSISQASVKIAKQTVSIKNKDSVAIMFINTILGGYFMSRLNSLIREKLGYTYGIYSSYVNYRLANLLTISSSIKGNVIYDALQRILDVMNDISINKIKEDEFELVKNYYLGSFLRSVETTPQVLTKISAIMTYQLEKNFYNVLYKKINDLTIDEIYSKQGKYFKPMGLNISLVGDKRKTLPQLKNLSGYEIIQKSKLY